MCIILSIFVNYFLFFNILALTDYDEVVTDDSEPSTKLVESLKLWKTVTSSGYIRAFTVFLVLTKSDLFEKKIEKIPLQSIFPDYDKVVEQYLSNSKTNYEKSWRYIERLFKMNYSRYDDFYTHVVNLLDSKESSDLFGEMQQPIFDYRYTYMLGSQSGRG